MTRLEADESKQKVSSLSLGSRSPSGPSVPTHPPLAVTCPQKSKGPISSEKAVL